MNCPKCGEQDLWRDSVDVGIGIMYGPYGCPTCGWSEDPEWDISEGPKVENGYRIDQWGGATPLPTND